MKRNIFKDIIVAVIPLLSFLIYGIPEQKLVLYSSAHYDYTALIAYRLFAPIIIGAAVCGCMIYAWSNRASTVFISFFCGAFLTNLFFALCQPGILGGLSYLSVMKGSSAIGMAAVIDGTYITMFWVSLISFIKSKRKK